MEFWIIIIVFIAMGTTCSLAGTWWDRKKKQNKHQALKQEMNTFKS